MADLSYVDQVEAVGAVLEQVGEAGTEAALASEGLADAILAAAKAAAELSASMNSQVYDEAAAAAEAAARGFQEWSSFQSGLVGLTRSYTTAAATTDDLVEAMYQVQVGAMDAADALYLVGSYVESQAELVGGWSSLASSVQAYAREYERRDWGAEEYYAEYARLSGEIESLNADSADYSEEQLELLNEQFEILKHLDALEQESLEAQQDLAASFQGAYGTLDQAITDLATGSHATVQSAAVYTELFQDLLLDALADAEAVSDFVSYATGDFLSFMSAYGAGDTAYDTALAALTALKDAYGDLSGGSMPDFASLAEDLAEVGDSLDYLSGKAVLATGEVDGLAGATGSAGSAAGATVAATASMAAVLAGTGVASMQALAASAGITGDSSLDTAGSVSVLDTELNATHSGFLNITNSIHDIVTNAVNGFQSVSTTFANLISTLQTVASGDTSDTTVDAAASSPVSSAAYITNEYWTTETVHLVSGTYGDYKSAYAGDTTGKWYYPWQSTRWEDLYDVARYKVRTWSDGTVEYLAKGGILTGPTVIGGEAGPEAVLPLTEEGVSKFTAGLGLDPESIGQAVAKALGPSLGSLADSVGKAGGEVSVRLNDRQIARSVGRKLVYDAEFVSGMRRVM